MENLMTVRNLTKSFKDAKVLNGINMDVKNGEILCILGPNGAGKSTTINILTAALSCDEGEITFKGKSTSKNLKEYKKSIGIVPQDISLYEELSAESNLRFFASLYGLKGKKLDCAVYEALVFVGLDSRKADKVKTFSGGMKRRLNIACAIAHKPEMIIMDEPTVGIDPQSRNHILNSILQLKEEGMTVIYTTHYMEEVETISSRIIIMDHGSIIASGTKETLKEDIENEKRYIIETENNISTKLDDFYGIEGVRLIVSEKNHIEITSLKNIENLDKIISLLTDNGDRITSITTETANLETVFLKMTGRKLRD